MAAARIGIRIAEARAPPADASTTTSVVWSQAYVPSDSGASVGTLYAETSIRSMRAGAAHADRRVPPARVLPPFSHPESSHRVSCPMRSRFIHSGPFLHLVAE